MRPYHHCRGSSRANPIAPRLPLAVLRRCALGATLALAGLTAVPQAANATDNAVVSLTACDMSAGTMSVPAGAQITIHSPGFAEGSYGLIEDFLLKERTTLTVSDGTRTVYNLSSQWATPEQLDRNLWVTRLPNTDTGITLGRGQSVVATFDITFTQPLLVAYPPVGSSGDNGPFLVGDDGPLSCVITGAAA